ncbi:osmotic avoidance abnormal protein 3-like isoform X2 [Schistocerca gregaria]|uniref:osmotic avoidance abnormal protein 3-like isoform X2 n=1 Tax=Schistocerca gregaria TaxID=7010 RepID=UPI00211F35D7|nr:osmotic avoidance abnormal protein 3-like isoform X2 [Schistocerca gregaria]
MSERVKVIVRCRPLSRKENEEGCKPIISMDSSYHSCSIRNPSDITPPKTFTFDGTYNFSSTTEQIYNEAAFPLVQDVLNGYNSTIFAYGQTGCGKSFTMQGSYDNFSERGVTPRAIEHIFEEIALAENTKYLVLVSHLEIYNDEIRDLLGSGRRNKLELKEHSEHGVFVQGISLHSVQGVHDCEKLMQKGINNRITAETQMNYDSSRSHSVFTIHVEIVPVNTSEVDGMQMKFQNIRKGKLNLVDLAGSERQGKAGTTGDRLKEATKINLSLSALGNVISSLVDGKSKYIPYRDSKLTRLLQDSLGGNTKTLMIACLSPADSNYEESLSTLRYANRAKNIKNKPHINEDAKDALLREYEQEIQRLKNLVETSCTTRAWLSDEQIQEEKEKLRVEYEQKLNKMRQDWEVEHVSKCKLEIEMQNLRNNLESKRYNTKEHFIELHYFPDEHCPEETSGHCSRNAAYGDILCRWKKLQKSLVGGERKHDSLLKARYINMRQTLRKTISRRTTSDEESIEDSDNDRELSLRQRFLKDKLRLNTLESENKDLQNEFEKERKNYLEIIGTLCRQMKLFKQITEKIVPNLRKDCSYSDLERVKGQAVWNEEAECWILPEFVYEQMKLPCIDQKPDFMTSQELKKPLSPDYCESLRQSSFSSRLSSPRSSNDEEDSILLKKLRRSEEENIAGNYFKSSRTLELLNKLKQRGWSYPNKGSSNY